MANTEHEEAFEELEQDEDVQKVVAMLENVEFSDTLGMSASHNFDGNAGSREDASDKGDMSGSGDRTPRADEDEEEDEDEEWGGGGEQRMDGRATTHTAKKYGRFR